MDKRLGGERLERVAFASGGKGGDNRQGRNHIRAMHHCHSVTQPRLQQRTNTNREDNGRKIGGHSRALKIEANTYDGVAPHHCVDHGDKPLKAVENPILE